MKRDDFIGNKFDVAMNKLMECMDEMRELGALTGDVNFDLFSSLLEIVFVAAGNKDMEELFNVVMPFVLAKAAEETNAEGSSELPDEISKLLRGLDGSDPSKLN